MFIASRDNAAGVPEPPGDFKSNYRHLKQIINAALKDGTSLEALHLIPKDPNGETPRKLAKKDLIKLLHILRRIRSRYQRLLQPPVPRRLEKDILAKTPEERLPWEQEALDKQEQWRRDVAAVRAQVQEELNLHLKGEFFREP